MIEKVKAVNNPLTIIAIFAALAEVAGTVALKLVAADVQVIFIWFVMIFPTLIVVLFFITLNFNPKVLYAPSDFKNEENFINILGGVNRLSVNLTELQKQLEEAKSQIIDDAVKQVGVAGENERNRLSQILNSRIGPIQESVEATRETAAEVIQEVPDDIPTFTEWRIMKILNEVQDGATRGELSEKTNQPRRTMHRLLAQLMNKGLIENRDGKYYLNPKGGKYF